MHRQTKYNNLSDTELLNIEPQTDLEIALWQRMQGLDSETDRFIQTLADSLNCDRWPEDIAEQVGQMVYDIDKLQKGITNLFNAAIAQKIDWADVADLIDFLADSIPDTPRLKISEIIEEMTRETFQDEQ